MYSITISLSVVQFVPCAFLFFTMQDRMWKEQSTSIFDLETLEIEAERMGEAVPWGKEGDDDILPGFDASGRMKIGGD